MGVWKPGKPGKPVSAGVDGCLETGVWKPGVDGCLCVRKARERRK
jgi:hypothetical protein